MKTKPLVLVIKVVLSIGILTHFYGCDKLFPPKSSPTKKEVKQSSSASKNVPEQKKEKRALDSLDQTKPLAENVLARVGAWQITLKEFNDRLVALKKVVPDYDIADRNVKKLVIEELVNQQLIVQDAEMSGLTEEKEVAAALEEFRRTLIVQEVARRLIQDITVSEEEAKEFYEQQRGEFRSPPQVQIREIVVSTKEEGTNLLIEILNGADFVQLAQEKSIAKSAAQGGDLGFLTELPFAGMLTALASLEEGDVSSVFKGPEGYYIIKLEAKKEGEEIPFEKVKEELIQIQTLQKRQKLIQEHLNKIKEKIPVELKEDLLES